MSDFNSKTLWIIGSNSDIAKAFCEKYGNAFGTVVLASQNYAKVREFATEIHLDNVLTFKLDISDNTETESFADRAPTPDVVLLCAGYIGSFNGEERTDAENIVRTMRVNSEGPIILLEKLLNVFNEKKGGTVIALSSCAGERGKGSNRIYSASKAALSNYLEGFMQTAKKKNIKTVIIKPGHVNTKMLDGFKDKKHRIFVAETEFVADCIMKSIQKNKSEIVYCKKIWKLVMMVYRAIPVSIYQKLEF